MEEPLRAMLRVKEPVLELLARRVVVVLRAIDLFSRGPAQADNLLQECCELLGTLFELTIAPLIALDIDGGHASDRIGTLSERSRRRVVRPISRRHRSYIAVRVRHRSSNGRAPVSFQRHTPRAQVP